MRQKSLIHISFLVLTIVNIAVIFFRGHFQYQPYADYNLLYASCGQSCVNKWKQYVDDYPGSELEAAKLISDSIIGKSGLTTQQKILSIGRFVSSRFRKQAGTPSPALLSASPLEQYKMLCSSDSVQLWCGNFAQVFSWFCWSQDIVTRNIEIMNPGDRHVLNECYLPETRKWVMADITHNLLLVSNNKGQYLDLPGFRVALKNGEPLMAWQAGETGMNQVPIEKNEDFIRTYYQKDHDLYYYHRVNLEKVYTTGEKIKRYFLPFSWYEILDERDHNNLVFYLKEVFLFLWIISVFVFMASRTKFRI